jgi:hypothetical protein
VEGLYIALSRIGGARWSSVDPAPVPAFLTTLEQVLPSCSNLRTLVMTGWPYRTWPPQIQRILSECKGLESISLSVDEDEGHLGPGDDVLDLLLIKTRLRYLGLHELVLFERPTFSVKSAVAPLTCLALDSVVLSDDNLFLLFSAVRHTLRRLECHALNYDVDIRSWQRPPESEGLFECISVAGQVRAFGELAGTLRWLRWAPGEAKEDTVNRDLDLAGRIAEKLGSLERLEVALVGVSQAPPFFASLPASLRSLLVDDIGRQPVGDGETTFGRLASCLAGSPLPPLTRLEIQSEEVEAIDHFRDLQKRSRARTDLEELRAVCESRGFALSLIPFCSFPHYGIFGLP